MKIFLDSLDYWHKEKKTICLQYEVLFSQCNGNVLTYEKLKNKQNVFKNR